jgi:hypothetical protein
MAFPEQDWKKAKKLCRLNEEDIRIAKQMGLNPKSLIKNIPSKDQLWKEPVKDWLWSMWEDRQEKARKKQAKKQAAAKEEDDSKE